MLALISCAGTQYIHGILDEKQTSQVEQNANEETVDKERVVRVKGVESVKRSNDFI